MKMTRTVSVIAAILATGAVLLFPACSDDSRPDTPLPDVTDDGRDVGADADADGGDVPGDVEDTGDGEVTCGGGLTWCVDGCVDLRTSNDHCGACGRSCGAGLRCLSGECRLDCSGAGLPCGDSCVDRLSDPDNCGTCENVCTAPQVCAAGACTGACPTGTTPCGRACPDTTSSIDHCGTCDRACRNLEWCLMGTCVENPCAAGDHFCDGMCVPNSVEHCGGCDVACDSGFTCCDRLFAAGMICVDLRSNPEYCGSCINMCPPANNCVGGSCVPV
ncbi:MAG: MXAN_6577-like cysteine-rich protein [Myxococcota bacterium]|nr:MXAN_6577-like cysteine-rich protein [Myxococcota bacterium]